MALYGRQEVILIMKQIDESTPLRTYERGVEMKQPAEQPAIYWPRQQQPQ
jgi:hypothetical protein